MNRPLYSSKLSGRDVQVVTSSAEVSYGDLVARSNDVSGWSATHPRSSPMTPPWGIA